MKIKYLIAILAVAIFGVQAQAQDTHELVSRSIREAAKLVPPQYNEPVNKVLANVVIVDDIDTYFNDQWFAKNMTDPSHIDLHKYAEAERLAFKSYDVFQYQGGFPVYVNATRGKLVIDAMVSVGQAPAGTTPPALYMLAAKLVRKADYASSSELNQHKKVLKSVEAEATLVQKFLDEGRFSGPYKSFARDMIAQDNQLAVSLRAKIAQDEAAKKIAGM